MSIESAKAYLQRLKSDQVFRDQIIKCQNAEEHLSFVREQGFDFSQEDLNKLYDELSDGELEEVAGGVAHLNAFM